MIEYRVCILAILNKILEKVEEENKNEYWEESIGGYMSALDTVQDIIEEYCGNDPEIMGLISKINATVLSCPFQKGF